MIKMWHVLWITVVISQVLKHCWTLSYLLYKAKSDPTKGNNWLFLLIKMLKEKDEPFASNMSLSVPQTRKWDQVTSGETLFLAFCHSLGKVKWHCTLRGFCIKERVVFQGFSHQICSVYKEKRFCSAASLPYATWSLSTQVFSFLFCASSASVRILPAKSQAFSWHLIIPSVLSGVKWLAFRSLSHFPFAVFGLQANRIKNSKKSCFK